jgi:putative effector of murein hydrolase/putative effector of murein hydrolase LrgA (UPF0299 family)
MKQSVVAVRAGFRYASSVAIGVAVLWAGERLCHALLRALGAHFPSSVAGMLAAFGGLLCMRSLAPALADRVARALAPARSFLTRWMALFFIPPLVQLPLSPVPGAKDLLACTIVVGGGFTANLALTARVASWGSSTVSVVQPKVTRAVSWPRRFVLGWWLAFTLVGLLGSLTVAWPGSLVVFGVSVAVVGFVLAEMGRVLLLNRGLLGAALVFHPVLISACVTGICWRLGGQPLSSYLHHGARSVLAAPGNGLMAFLSPAVVALGLILDSERVLLRANVRALLVGTTCGSLFSLLSGAALSRMLGLSDVYARAVLPKAVTTPVALVIAEIFGGDAGLTSVFVVLTGVIGALFAAPLLRWWGVDLPFAQGVATGVSSHGIGTAALLRDNPQAAAFSAISFALTAALSVAFASMGFVQAAVEWLLVH